ncbi:hypothetical protein Q8F55_008221 [Vanrija albida]|uniref:Uncharacterized protein n=1 Tax=Vanrija albida TaxID=181172 RepID=A0ABR3PVZ4_9TREE
MAIGPTPTRRSEPFHLGKYIVAPQDTNPAAHAYAFTDAVGCRRAGQVPVLRFASEVEWWLSKEEAVYLDFALAVIRSYVDYKADSGRKSAPEVADKLLAVETQVVLVGGLAYTADAFAQVRRERGLGRSSVLAALEERERKRRAEQGPARRHESQDYPVAPGQPARPGLAVTRQQGEHVPPAYTQAVDAAAPGTPLVDQVRTLVGLVARLESRVRDLERGYEEEKEHRRALESQLAVLIAEQAMREGA